MSFVLRILNWMTTIVVAITLNLLAVRILLTPLFINIEYRMPGFPVDPYGFSLDERLYWADVSRQYLLNQEDISFLADQKLDPDVPLYNQRELRHMNDVKVVVRGAFTVLFGCILFLVVYGYWSKRADRWQAFKHAVSRGGWTTVGLIVLILMYLVFNFNSLFTNFHKIFFEGDTWLFRYSDTLIRLFPIIFWRDAFIWIGTLALLTGAGIGYFGGRRS
jgi:integral membrane protein (TIGR01906 family)